MPIYSYRCCGCNHEHEHREYREEIGEVCEVCNAHRIFKRRIAPTTFVLKGSGWTGKVFTPENS